MSMSALELSAERAGLDDVVVWLRVVRLYPDWRGTPSLADAPKSVLDAHSLGLVHSLPKSVVLKVVPAAPSVLEKAYTRFLSRRRCSGSTQRSADLASSAGTRRPANAEALSFQLEDGAGWGGVEIQTGTAGAAAAAGSSSRGASSVPNPN